MQLSMIFNIIFKLDMIIFIISIQSVLLTSFIILSVHYQDLRLQSQIFELRISQYQSFYIFSDILLTLDNIDRVVLVVNCKQISNV